MVGDKKHTQNEAEKWAILELVWILICIVGKNPIPLCISPELDKIVSCGSSSTDIGFEMTFPSSALS
jgi:hypothetical protein